MFKKIRILCFGDSNTYGFDPRDPIENRYPPSERWPEILSAQTGWEVINLGLNGRTIPHAQKDVELAISQIQKEELNESIDCLILMLGSNDVFKMHNPSADKIAERMQGFLSQLRGAFPSLPIFLISPPRVEIPLAHIQELFWELIPRYRKLADEMGLLFATAPLWDLPLSADAVHFSATAHYNFAMEIEKNLMQSLRLSKMKPG